MGLEQFINEYYENFIKYKHMEANTTDTETIILTRYTMETLQIKALLRSEIAKLLNKLIELTTPDNPDYAKAEEIILQINEILNQWEKY